MSRTASFVRAMLAASLAAGAAASPVAPPIGGDLVLEHATVHVGDGRVLPDAMVVVRKGLVASVGTSVVPRGARVLDCTGLHVTPGLFAADTVLGLSEISAIRATRDDTEIGVMNPNVRAWMAFNPDSELLGVAMANGLEHALVAPRGGVVSGMAGVMLLSGWTREDMLLRGPAALEISWPSLALDRHADVKTPLDEQERHRTESLEQIDELFDQARSYLDARRSWRRGMPVTATDERLEGMAPVLSREVPVVVHADSVPQIRSVLAWGKRRGLRVVLAGAQDGWRIADEIATAGVPVIVGGVRALPAHDMDAYDAAYEAPVILYRAGVKVCFNVGGDSFSAAMARNLPDEAAMTIAWGMPPEEALRAITSTPAEIFGVGDRVGTVSEGKMADLVVWDGPPMEITSRVSRILLRGEEIPIADRHTKLWEKYRARPAPSSPEASLVALAPDAARAGSRMDGRTQATGRHHGTARAPRRTAHRR